MTRPPSPRSSPSVAPTAIRLVSAALKNEFDGLIDVSDVTNPDLVERERSFLTRALAALIVRDRTGCTSREAAENVVDGRNDYGIDAVAIDEDQSRLWLIQTKWSHRGEAGIGVGEALKLREGLSKIDRREYSSFNPKLRTLAERASSVLSQGRLRITLTIVLMGSQSLSPDVRQRLNEVCAEFNGFGQILDYDVVLARDVWHIVQAGVAEPTADLSVKMEQWFQIDVPFKAYSGAVSVGEVATWLAEHGTSLFTRNIRKSLGVTRVNQSLVETLTSEPHHFWYFNNGITVLCDEFTVIPFSRGAPHGPVSLELRRASVVNGAQTVTAAHEAVTRDPDTAGQAHVTVKVIATGAEPEDLSREITKANNTQNQVERRDYVSLDPVQSTIKDDFALSLGKSYVVKRGEIDPPPEAGCSVLHAAIALACAHTSAELAGRAKRDPDLLWEEGSTGAYRLLFHPPPSAVQIWRSVLLLRAVRHALRQGQTRREGRASAIAEHGDLLVAHITFQHIGLEGIDDPDFEWDAILEQAQTLADRVLAMLIHHIDRQFGQTSFITSTFTNPDRCRTLARKVLEDLRAGSPVPSLPPEYRPPEPPRPSRRRNTVPVLIDAGRIKEGETLVFQPRSEAERLALSAWLKESPRRARATWTNHRGKPLLWAEDGKRYSPTGLVQHIWRLAEWGSAPVSVQGPMQWHVPGEGSLVELAESTLREEELPLQEYEGPVDVS